MLMPQIENTGWVRLGSSRAWPTTVTYARLPQARVRRRLVDEIVKAENDVLLGRRGASAELYEDLMAALSEANSAVFGLGRGRGGLPDWLGLVESGGHKSWDPFMVEFAPALKLVNDDFTAVLASAGCTRGWSTQPVPVFDRHGRAVDTHRALIVPGILEQGDGEGERHELLLRRDRLPSLDEAPALAWIGESYWLVASPPAAKALAAAKLPGLALRPVRAAPTGPQLR